ncbi:MAG: Ig-like domain-containing protein [Oscillospiraceae bacterium]|nr:Ig-like domain-containing protein [Oscillospiraceae bacterium]
MKKIYKSVLISIIITVLLSMLFTFPTSAANVRYSVTGASGAKGDTVTVSVNLSSDTKIWGANVSLGFNSNELEYISCAQGGLVSGGSLNRSGSRVNFSGMYNGKSGTVFTVKFKILKDSGTSALSLSSTENTDDSGKVYACSATGASVTVIKSVTGISLNSSGLNLSKGETAQLNATVAPSDATNKTVTYSSSNSNVAKVDSNGKITAVSGGTAKITATAGGKSAVCTVNVKVNQTGIAVSGSKDRKVGEGSILKLTTVKVPADATDNYAVSWASSDNSIATVSGNGTVTGVKQGTAVITATSNGWKAVYNITVTEKSDTSETESTSDEELSSEDVSGEETSSEEPSSNLTTDPTGESENTTDGKSSEKSNFLKNFFDKVFDKDKTENNTKDNPDESEKETVTKGYYYTMLILVGVITALVTVPVTALVTSNICKNKNKRKDEIYFDFEQK